ncbi:MAG TPA: DUF6569 family protein [Candidatus Acidoferrales bacterium]|nr:DUF6569 family protein [Candidatus Acidoferrales bacterium]
MIGKDRILVGALAGGVFVLLAAALSAGGAWRHTISHIYSSKMEVKDWRVLSGIAFENLTIFPVVATMDQDTSGFATLDQALASGEALVTEEGGYLRRTRDGSPEPAVYSGAQVNQLVLVNRGKRPLLLLAGEVVSGGKQDRIIGKDRIVPVGAEPLPLDVFCVEHGRWTGASDKFADAKTMVHPTVREKAAVEADQGQVWAAVGGAAPPIGSASESVVVTAASSGASGGREMSPLLSAQEVTEVIDSAAPTQSYRKIYQSPKVTNSVEEFAQEIERRFSRATQGLKGERVVGVVVAYNGETVWSDVFASSNLFEAYWPKLLRSYVVEALTRPRTNEKVSLSDAQDFLRPASGHIREESEPGVYVWREQTEGSIAEIQIEALEPKPMTLHWLRVVRTD